MNVLELFKNVTTFIFDVDGVLTDSTVLLVENGLQARTMNVKDGLGLQIALKNGFGIVVISGGTSKPVSERLTNLGLKEVHLGIEDKKKWLENYLQQNSLEWKEILFMGDDLPDIPSMKKAGVSACPGDAVNEIKAFAHYISPVSGGSGCVRDIIEKVLKVQDKWIFDPVITAR